ncbi:putative DNA repair protein [Litorivivens lipolytica]|uniref:Putative DNA repair protein n=1 Tax=Litorivivens lipolytica TaxID=1524264 RepID=A0A7W4W6V3_9GAMM|nr:PD-(D/E)XK nuclease family protein [Litorivivens lipolytica]MBB3048581.1 putative DNA repair protein [Litorivivens lipolytica]
MLNQYEAVTPQDWDEWLKDGQSTIVLVDHDGEAADLRRRIAEAQGQAYLEYLRVLPKAQWWVELWDNSFPELQVLRPVQVLALAEACIEGSDYLAPSVIGVQGIARQFVDAFELAERFGLTVEAGPFAGNEQRAFCDWRQRLRERLLEQGALTGGQLISALAKRLDALELPVRLVLSKELELTPPEQQLLKALQGAGVALFQLLPADVGDNTACQQASFASVQEEVEAAARWVASWQRRAESPRLALIASDMNRYEMPLQRALERFVYPASLFPASQSEVLSEPWRVGTGRLSAYPIIASALDALQVAQGEVGLEQLSRLLRSPFVAGAHEQAASRAQLDWRWRERFGNRGSLSRALALSQDEEATTAFQALCETAQGHAGRAQPSTWVARFDAELLALGWPNRDAGDPVVDQCRQGFSQVMDTLRALDRQLGKIGRSEALRWLQHVLQGKRFELRRDEAPPLQLLNLEEASGQHFDAIWVLGLSDAALPQAVPPSPFLPRELLVAAGVPRADHSDALRRDTALLKTVLASAGEAVISYPAQSDDAVAQAPCTLLDWNYPLWEPVDGEQAFSVDAAVEVPEEEKIRPVSAKEKSQLRGGTGLFRAYALSPFYAFLKYRLGLQALPEPVEGLDPKTQGNWIHRALELFWREAGGSDIFQSESDDQIEARLNDAIDQAMSEEGGHGDELRRIEKRRLLSLLKEWLDFERNREEAFRVKAVEAAGSVDAFGLPLHIKIDRVDEIDGKTVVMDYKTGSIAANKLNAENLLEPQLPMYALLGRNLVNSDIDGVVLAQIHPRGMMAHMRSSWSATLVPGKPRNPVDSPDKWQAECEAWERVLSGYAQGFLGGEAGHDSTRKDADFKFDPFVPVLARGGEVDDD